MHASKNSLNSDTGFMHDCRVLPRDAPCGIPASFFKMPHQANLEGAIPAPVVTVQYLTRFIVRCLFCCSETHMDISYTKLKLKI